MMVQTDIAFLDKCLHEIVVINHLTEDGTDISGGELPTFGRGYVETSR